MSTTVQSRAIPVLQKISMSLMGVLVLLTFIGANLHAVLWQSSEWLVSTVLPAVVVDLTNEEREANNAAPLIRNATLDEAARRKAQHMAELEYFAHFSPSGVSPWHWFDQVGYVYAHAGENLAIHFTDSDEVVEAWMNSPAHRANIVDGKYTEIGVGTAKGTFEGYDTVYVVQLFGTPAVPPAPVIEDSVLAAQATETVAEAPVDVSAELARIQAEAAALADVLAEVELPQQSAEVAVLSETGVSVEKNTVPVEGTQAQPVEPTVVDAVEAGVITLPETVVVAQQEEKVEEIPISDVVVVEMPLIATSSGLAVAQVTTPAPQAQHAGATLTSVATQPNTILQIIYSLLAVVVLMMLSASVVIESKRMHPQQVAYGLALLFMMGGLWFAHSLLTTGAVIA
jgi:hypothetical protein